MKTLFHLALAVSVLLFPSVCRPDQSASATSHESISLQALINAYPDAGITAFRNAHGLHIALGDATLLFQPASGCPDDDPGAHQDLPVCASMMRHYPTGAGGRAPLPGTDPGRTRHEGLLKLLYGGSRKAVSANCVEVSFLGQRIAFNAKHGAADALARVCEKLEALIQADPGLMEYLLPVGGAFFWRNIEGSERLSSHSFGIAIDLNVDKGPYWRWTARTDSAVHDAQKNYPQAIIDAFEEEGFIWGGKWHSFDFMHFEFRPELLGKQP